MRARRTVTGAVLFLGFAAAQPLAAANRALVVGIDTYAEPRLSFQLQGASKRDSDQIVRLLQASLGFAPEDIRMLRDGAATKAAILAGIRTWLGSTGPGDRAFFYFVGHGHFTKDLDGDEPDGLDETLVPHDARVVVKGSQAEIENMILDDELFEAFNRLKGVKVTAVFDSCHSGTVTRAIGGARVNPSARTPQLMQLTRSITDPGVKEQKAAGGMSDPAGEVDLTLWTAVSPTLLALIEEDAAPDFRGVFTTALAEGIERGVADANRNGVISNQELLDFVREQSAAYCRKKPGRCEMGLTATLEGRDAAAKVAALNPEIVQLQADAPKPVSPDKPAVVPAGPPKIVPGGSTKVVPGGAPFVPVDLKPGDPIAQGKVTPDKILDLVAAKVDPAVRVEQIPPSPIKVGTKDIRFRVTSPRDGFLVLLSLSDAGELVQLFPNQFSRTRDRDGRIRAGAPITMPDAYYGTRFDANTATTGTVIALISRDPLRLPPTIAQRKIEVIAAEEANKTFLPALAQTLAEPTQTETVAANTKQIDREVGLLRYEIRP